MLKNAPTLAIGGADTAENEPPKVRQVSNKIRRNIGAKELCPRDGRPGAAYVDCLDDGDTVIVKHSLERASSVARGG